MDNLVLVTRNILVLLPLTGVALFIVTGAVSRLSVSMNTEVFSHRLLIAFT